MFLTKLFKPVLPLEIVDGLVWTYGLSWSEQDGKLTGKSDRTQVTHSRF